MCTTQITTIKTSSSAVNLALFSSSCLIAKAVSEFYLYFIGSEDDGSSIVNKFLTLFQEIRYTVLNFQNFIATQSLYDAQSRILLI